MKRTNKRSYEFNDRTIHIHEQTRKTKQQKRKQQAEMKEETKEQIQEQEQEDTKKNMNYITTCSNIKTILMYTHHHIITF